MPNNSLKILLLAAGFGTRLKDLTKNTPKPLVALGNKKIIDAAIWQIKQTGVKDVIVNLHYLGDQISSYLGDGSQHGLKISYSQENPILDTGGAIKKIFSQFGSSDLLVYNCDAVFGADLNLQSFISSFYQAPNNPIAKMLLRPEDKISDIGINSENKVVRVLKASIANANESQALRFCGIHLFSKQTENYLKNLPEVFSSTTVLYPQLLHAKEEILAQIYQGFWCDCGSLESLKLAQAAVQENKVFL